MKEHTLGLGTLLLLLAVLFPFSEVEASTDFTALYRYEVDPARHQLSRFSDRNEPERRRGTRGVLSDATLVG